MPNYTTDITVTKAISRLAQGRIESIKFHEAELVEDADGNPQMTTPFLAIEYLVCGPPKRNAQGVIVQFSNPYKRYHLIAYDSLPSIVLRRNAAPRNAHDELTIVSLVVNDLMTTLKAAFDANVAGADQDKKRRANVDAVAVSSGLLGPEFASA